MKLLFLGALAVPFLLAASQPGAAQAQQQRRQQQQHRALPSFAVPNGVGVNIHFTDARPGEMEMLAEAFHVVRMDLTWDQTEKQKGVYDFSAYDRLMKSLAGRGIRALFILDYKNRLYDQNLSPHTDEGRAAFARWAAAAASHFKGRGVLWELYNEPNTRFWSPRPNVEDYIKLDKAVSAAIRQAAPGECYFGAATSGIDLEFLEACFRGGALERWDAVSVHPYRQGDPETAAPEYRRLRLLIECYKPAGKTVPILSGEWGYSTVWNNFSDERQGKYLPRQWLVNLMNDVPLSVWYDWHDDGPDEKEPEHHFGSVEFPYFENREPVYNPKPAYQAARTFVKFFNGHAFNKRIALASPDDYLLVFQKGRGVRLAVWTTKEAHEVLLPASSGAFRVTNHLGAVLPELRAGKDGLKLTISDAPLYLQPVGSNVVLQRVAALKRAPLDLWTKAPAQLRLGSGKKPALFMRRSTPAQSITINNRVGRFDVRQTTVATVTNPLQLELTPVADRLQVRVLNPAGEALRGTLAINGGAAQLVVFAVGETATSLSFSRPLRDAGGTWQARARFVGVRENDVVEVEARFVPLPGFSTLDETHLAQRLLAAPDGDAKIESRLALSMAEPPAPSPAGEPAVRLEYSFAQGWKFANVQPRGEAAQQLAGRPAAFGLWIYGDGSGNKIRMRYRDASGQTFQPDGPSLDWRGWRYCEFPLDDAGGYWGGAGDGTVHYPIALESLLILDSVQSPNNQGAIYFTSPVLIYKSELSMP